MTTVTKEVLGVVDGQWSPRAFWRTATADAVARQLKAGADPRHADLYGLTSLHWAALMDNPDVMPLLVEAGIDIDARDAQGNTALLLAAEKGNLARAAMHAREGMAPVVVGIRTLEMLLQLGAEADVVNKGKWSPLHWVVAWDAPEATDMLLRIGTSINIPGFQESPSSAYCRDGGQPGNGSAAHPLGCGCQCPRRFPCHTDTPCYQTLW